MSKRDSIQEDTQEDFEVPVTADEEEGLVPNAQVIIHGRNVEVPEHFANRIKGKLARLERLDPGIIRFEVELRHEKNPRQSRIRDRMEITGRRKGAPVRAEAAEDSFYAALESACDKLERSLRKVKVRRGISRSGHRTPTSLHEASAAFIEEDLKAIRVNDGDAAVTPTEAELGEVDTYADLVEDSLPGRIVRHKVHPDDPMTVDDALYQMELVGHDFFLFHNSETDKPCVVYRRRAYDYGLITLGE
ncbi:hypothetical protein AL705_06510 [Lawsonella clevelandensis]|uniref:Ribosome hibernation promoting factor n=1 Tax=Lawsonella clevelandensis TaxID=1528099 RepID=A0A0M4MCL8_9ACTN|nr:ribosome-associated translation inhibitor RaiA [Lawsonella clevelandensis]ALE19271.1 hypothetical protein AL705_06510 [Lawsonella clevelandensis]MDU7192688.1 ribosome-associated translation inhibitor RaiA [Lawsonella clevelandensis]VHO01310.1 Ribosome hibernation promotion factor [Lawsonella clevelandensis]